MLSSPLDRLRLLLETADSKDDQVFAEIMILSQISEVASEEKFADELLVSRATINRWSRGRNLPGLALRLSICSWILNRINKLKK